MQPLKEEESLFTYFIIKILKLKLAYSNLIPPPLPITLTFSVTNRCQSRCLTCKIWDFYRCFPHLKGKELSLEEIRKIFKGIKGSIYFFNVSGGEPYLREDLSEIIKLAIEEINPRIIHIPTNGLNPEVIEKTTTKIIDYLKVLNWPGVLSIKPSLDGVGKRHDEIRGVPGNFEKVMETFKRLKEIKQNFPYLSVEAGTVISKFNLNQIDELSSLVKDLRLDNYRNEIAEIRAEFLNQGNDITPSFQEYEKIIEDFKRKVIEDIRLKSPYTKKTQAFRFVYYDLVVKILKEKKQVIPCLAAFSNVHLTPFGDLWPCCVLGENYSLGSLKNNNFDFMKVWRSKKALEIRKFIKGKVCFCPLANQAYNNLLCDLSSLIKILRIFKKLNQIK